MNIMNAMMLSCVKATELMEMKENVPLGLLKQCNCTCIQLCVPVAEVI
jgi:hypothetical protein